MGDPYMLGIFRLEGEPDLGMPGSISSELCSLQDAKWLGCQHLLAEVEEILCHCFLPMDEKGVLSRLFLLATCPVSSSGQSHLISEGWKELSRPFHPSGRKLDFSHEAGQHGEPSPSTNRGWRGPADGFSGSGHHRNAPLVPGRTALAPLGTRYLRRKRRHRLWRG